MNLLTSLDDISNDYQGWPSRRGAQVASSGKRRVAPRRESQSDSRVADLRTISAQSSGWEASRADFLFCCRWFISPK